MLASTSTSMRSCDEPQATRPAPGPCVPRPQPLRHRPSRPAPCAARSTICLSSCLSFSILPLIMSFVVSRASFLVLFFFLELTLHGAGRETAHQHPLKKEKDQRHRQCADQCARGADAPDRRLTERELAHDHRQRLDVRRRGQKKCKEEIVPAHDEGEQS